MSLHEAIDKSKYILDLPNDWDDQGSPAYNRNVWENVIIFLKKWDEFLNHKMIVPKIWHGPDGGIDIYFDSNNFEMFCWLKPNNECSWTKKPWLNGERGKFIFEQVDFNTLPKPIDTQNKTGK